jgi:5-methyltetrahydropteroyltriglutamate--homocysteine methyltransferase
VNDRLGALPVLPTTLVGSWSKPGWLIDEAELDSHLPVRVERHSLWRVDADLLDEAQIDATRLAVLEQVYPTDEDLAMAFAEVVAAEIADLFAAGADIVQIDEPYLQARPGPAADYGMAAIDHAVTGAAGRTALHICLGYGRHVPTKPAHYDFLADLDRSHVDEISVEAAQPRLDLAVLDELASKRVEVGVLDLRDTTPDPVATVVERINAALEHVPTERLVIAPDCGFKYFRRADAIAKVTSMVEAVAIVRAELAR